MRYGPYGALPANAPESPMPMTIISSSQAGSTSSQPPTPETVSAQIFDGIVGVAEAFAQHRRDSMDPLLTPEGQQARLREFGNSEQAKALAQYETAADQLVAEKQAARDAQYKALTPQGDSAAELRAQRTWGREKSKLDTLSSEGEKANAVRSAIENCQDTATLATLIEELPDYLKTHGVDPSWLPAVVAAKVPAFGASQGILDKAKQERDTLKHAALMVRRGIENGSAPTTLASLRPAAERFDPDV
jgi:hypothetical protein